MQFSNPKNQDPVEIRKKCSEYAKSQIENQKSDFKRFGIMGDWDNAYTTMKPEYEAAQLEIFLKMFQKGFPSKF
jgi:isoleucyl-tRNA synthetase